MSGLVDYADDSSDISSDGEIVVGAEADASAGSKSAVAATQPALQPASGGAQRSAAQAASHTCDLGPAREPEARQSVEEGSSSSPSSARPIHDVPSTLAARFEHFTQLTMQGNDLVDALQGRMLGPSSAAQTAEPGSYSTALPSGACAAPPDFRSLLRQAEQQEAELASLHSSFPHMRRVSGTMHAAGPQR